jgi:3'-5' exoribonuclease
MPRQFINQISDQQQVDEIFLASGKQLRTNRNGSLYLQVELSDKSGKLPTRMWNATDKIYGSFDDGDYVRVEGTAQIFQGAMQMIAKQLKRVSADEVDETDFQVLPPADMDALAGRLAELLRGMNNLHLRSIAECYLMDATLMEKIAQAPAGVKLHHAFRGGLMKHVVSLMDLAVQVGEHYKDYLDPDQLLMGAFLHDLGKVDELGYERDFTYTEEGQLIGHIFIGVRMLEEKIAEAEKLSGEPIPTELCLRLKHMVVSHHGELAFGSPTVPMTVEAAALHYLDNLDAKVHSFSQLIREDPNIDSPWTTYQPNLGRKLYKGGKK